MTTLSDIAAYVVSGVPYPKREIPPSETVTAFDSYKVLQAETTPDILQKVEDYGRRKFEDPAYEDLSLENQITSQNAYSYLAAAKCVDMRTGAYLTLKIRQLCLLKSKAEAGRRFEITLMNAFSTPPARTTHITRIMVNELDNTHPQIKNLKDEDQKRFLARRLFEYCETEAFIFPPFVPIIESVMKERLEAMRLVSNNLPSNTSTFYVGPSGAGKTHALKLFTESLKVPTIYAVHSTDHFKVHLLEKVEKMFSQFKVSDFQVFLMGLSMNKMMMREVRRTFPGLSVLQEGWLAKQPMETLFDDLKKTGMHLNLQVYDGDFFAICLRVLSRYKQTQSHKVPFEDVIDGFKKSRNARQFLRESMREGDSCRLHYLQNNGDVIENANIHAVVCDLKLMELEIETAKATIITEEHSKNFGDQLRPFIGLTLLEAMALQGKN